MIASALASVLLLASTTAAVPETAAPVAPAPKTFTIQKLNRTYRDLVSDFAPMQRGGMTLTLSSPKQMVQVKDNKATLTAHPDGIHDAVVTIELLGKGDLAGDLEFAGQSTRLQDEFVIPQQTLTLSGRIRIEAAETGYSLTTASLPGQMEVTVKSGIAGRFVTWCERVALIPFTNMDCAGLEQSLTVIQVPLPAAGEKYVLPYEELSSEERQAIDEYLGLR
jgi:hypothetical protein